MAIQQMSTLHAMTAIRLTGRRKENIQTISWKLVLSARSAASEIASGVAAGGFAGRGRRGLSPSFPFGSAVAEGGLVAGEVGGADGVVDTLLEVGNPYAIDIRFRVNPRISRPGPVAAAGLGTVAAA